LSQFNNLLLIVVDSLRYDYFINEGYREILCPSTTYLCKVTSASTTTSIPILVTGKQNPKVETVLTVRLKHGNMDLVKVLDQTLFDVFGEAGFYTQYVSVDSVNQGDVFGFPFRCWFPSFPAGKSLRYCLDQPRFCVLLHCWGVHYPYTFKREGLSRQDMFQKFAYTSIKDCYREAVQNYKAVLQSIVETVPPKTLIVLTSDHGELLGEHGRFFHGGPLTPELENVPLCFYPYDHHLLFNLAVPQVDVLSCIIQKMGL